MIPFAILFVTQIIEGILIIILLSRLQGVNKQIEHIVKEVKGYIAFITEETEEEWKADTSSMKRNNTYLSAQGNKNREEIIQSQVIHDVLQEYFP